MKCIISVVSLFVIVSVSAAASIESPDNFEDIFESRALNYGQASRSGIAEKVLCVTDTIDRVVTEYQCKPVWQNIEQKLKNSIGNLFLCLKYEGFQVQAYVFFFLIHFLLTVECR